LLEPEADRAVVGSSIRSTRLLRSLTLRDLADRANCSESLISKIENDRTSPSLSTLQRIARALDVTIASLVSPIDRLRVVSPAGQREVVPIDGLGSRVERLVPADAEHMLEAHLHVLQPGGGSEGAIVHHGEEVGYVVEGRLELTVGAETFQLKAGDSFNFRSEIAHSYRNPGRGPARIVWVSTPSRQLGRPGRRNGSGSV
jgi:transcriptional regulator with XRE-family HTH domain